jgi:hypothetical protein
MGGSVVSLGSRLGQWWQRLTKHEAAADPPEDPLGSYLDKLKRFGTLATGALAVVTAVLGVFGIREGIPARILRDQPVATLISFMLIGLAILLAALSIFSFDHKHPKFEVLQARDDNTFWSRLLANGLSFFFSALLLFFVAVLAAFWVGGWIEEVSFSLPRQLLLAAAAAALGAMALLVVWSAKPVPDRNAEEGPVHDRTAEAIEAAHTAEAAKRTRRMITTSVVYFSLGLLLVAVLAVTSPGLTKRPRITVALDGLVLTSTIKGEDVGANRTYTIVVKLVSDAGGGDMILQQLQTGGDAEGKVDVTVKAALPTGRGGKVLIVAVPSERVERPAATPSTPSTAATAPMAATAQDPERPRNFDIKPTVNLEVLRDCPGGHTVIACALIVHPSQATTQLTDVTLTTATAGQPHTLKFKVTAGNLKVDQRVQVAVTVFRTRRVTIYDGVLSVKESGGFDAQNLTVQVPHRATRVCINARIITNITDTRRGAVCPAAKNNGGVASVWLRVPSRAPVTAT